MPKKDWVAAVTISALLVAAPAAAQEPPPQNSAARRLTLAEAVQRGLAHNLRVLAAGTRTDETAAAARRREALLYPRVRAEATSALQNRSLRAFGISAPGLPAVVDPFSTFDYRLYAEQPVVDRQAVYAARAAHGLSTAAQEEQQDARDAIVRHVTALYLNAQAADARTRAAASRVVRAEALLRLARERRDAGVATGIEVLRAEVQLANEQQRRLEAANAARQSLLVLARETGLSPGAPLELAEPLGFAPLDAPPAETLLARALADRADLRALAAERRALDDQRRANRARYLPRFVVGGNYGGIGRSPASLDGTGAIQATLSVTLYDRDRQPELDEIDARARRLDHRIADLRLGVEQELRSALLAIASAAEEVAVAGRGRELAAQELALAEERFAAGVATNIEIVTAQDSLARAEENRILALVRHSDAKMALARALGATERIWEFHLGYERQKE